MIAPTGPRGLGRRRARAPDLDERRAVAARPQAQGDRDALVERYAHLVKYVVGRLGVSIPGVFDREDAMQAGTMGLLRAIDAYRADSAASFESYAIVRIRGSILDAVRALDSVGRAGPRGGPRDRAGDARARDGARPHARGGGARRPPQRHRGPLPRAARRGVRGHGLARRAGPARRRRRHARRSPTPTKDHDALDPGDEAARRDDVVTLAREISRLGDRQKLVLALYYQDELTFREIGEVLGVTESRVCQIHTEAILVAPPAHGGARPPRPLPPQEGPPMIRGAYTSISGMIAAQRRMDVLGNNIANVNTTGFKEALATQSGLGFGVGSDDGRRRYAPLGQLGVGTYASGLTDNWLQGPLLQTGIPTDLAVAGRRAVRRRHARRGPPTRAPATSSSTPTARSRPRGPAGPRRHGASRSWSRAARPTFTVAARRHDRSRRDSGSRSSAVPATGLSRMGDNLFAIAGAVTPVAPGTGDHAPGRPRGQQRRPRRRP